MFNCIHKIIREGWIHKYSLLCHTEPLSYAEVLHLWQQNQDFCTWFVKLLSDSPFSAYRWETPPITIETANQPFEFVLLNSPGLAGVPDTKTYAAYFTTSDENHGIVTFENLGKDALLIVPSPRCSASAYRHLAAFIRHAPKAQKQALWRNVGHRMQHHITHRPLWLNTAGGGVSWLHIRLDSRPKYYGFKPYKLSPI